MKKLIVLILLIAVAATGLVFCTYHPPQQITGTYCSGEQVSGEDIYLALEQDGSYTLYRQFELLQSGSYHREQELEKMQLFSLRSAESAATWLLWDGGEQLLLLSADTALPLHKISDTPSYINLP